MKRPEGFCSRTPPDSRSASPPHRIASHRHSDRDSSRLIPTMTDRSDKDMHMHMHTLGRRINATEQRRS